MNKDGIGSEKKQLVSVAIMIIWTVTINLGYRQ